MRGAALLLLLGACAGAPEKSPPEPSRPDQALVDVPTRVVARNARIVLSSHWRPEAQLEAIHVERGDGSEWKASGGAVLRLRGIHAEIADELTITFLDDHEHVVIYATDVDLVERKVEFLHRHRNLRAITIADDKLNIFGR
jgi:hypothetical protein